jgi:cell division protein FtsB
MSIPAQVKNIVVSLLLLLATANFLKTTFNIMHSSQRLSELKQEVASLEEQEKILEERISYKQTAEFVEKEAREKLSMVLPGEEIFVYPEGIFEKSVLGVSDIVTAKEASNVKLWLQLFL